MSNKRKKAGQDTSTDWRSTVFCWQGVLLREEGDELLWRGVWVGSDLPTLPSPEALAGSQNSFVLKLNLVEPSRQLAPVNLSELAGKSGSFRGSYKLDQGDGLGLQSFQDVEHLVFFSDLQSDAEGGYLIVGACGNTEFGRFVSHGRVTLAPGTDEGQVVLTLARRYLRDADPRAACKTASAALELAALGSHERAPARARALGDLTAVLPWRVAKPSAKARTAT